MRTILIMILMATAACPAPVGVQSGRLPADSAGQCAAQCNEIGLALDAVVVMANNVGCVCRPAAQFAPPTAGQPSARAASSAGGLTAVLLAIQEQQRVAQSQQSSQRR